MDIQVFQSEALAAQAAATLFAAQIISKPDSVLGLATGGTPLPCYGKLIEWHRMGGLDFAHAHSFNLDEYCGIAPDHPQSYHFYMEKHFFSQVNLPKANRHVPKGDLPREQSDAWQAECRAYDRAIAEAGGIDLQLLGIGGNGHIGFNEPAEAFTGDTHIVALASGTIEDNSRYFDSVEQVPTHAITLGIRSIFAARHIVLLATGEGKAQILQRLVQSEVDPHLPASILQIHPRVTVLADRAAARLLEG